MQARDSTLEQDLFKLGATRTVYSFYYPEVKNEVERLWLAKPHYLYEKPYLRKVASLHDEFAEAWQRWATPVVTIDREAFPFFYPCAGSSEAIRDLISHIGRQRGRIHVFRGEYEGYRAYAKAFAVDVVEHDRHSYSENLRDTADGDWFFLSQPSSLDGNLWSGYDDFLKHVEARCPRLSLAIDLCYVGTTSRELPRIALGSPCIRTIFFSLSKVYGVYFHRIGGVFHRAESPSLTGNEYFRNNFSLLLGKELLSRFGIFDLPGRYRPKRDALVDSIATAIPGLRPSDVLMLAHKSADTAPAGPLETYVRRHGFVRVCLTPGLDSAVGR